ncbi:MAG: alkaline phosphatase [Chloroflexi bacterium]|jgi:hypothetical protein|nr:metallophosphoesterase [Anaerolineaceae bacterium]NMB91120.1 alkaline phosphatase [Chloroflexota bacterium]
MHDLHMTRPVGVGLALLCLGLLAACGGALAPTPTPVPTSTDTPAPTGTPTLTPSPSATPTATPTATPQPAVLIGAGDIAICGQDGDDLTADLLAANPGEVFTAGDNNDENGTLFEYERCFDPSWGRFKDRMHPSPGNHDYNVDYAADYFTYFGEAAGQPRQGWYSYDLGGWHIVSINSNCPWLIGGCVSDSPQAQWLREDLEAHPAQCTLAYWHHPIWSSGLAGSSFWLGDLYQILYEHGAEVVVNGHDHDYERFAPQDPSGNLDEANGIRAFVVGTGGVSLRPFDKPLPNSEVRSWDSYGVIKFTLYPDRYEWEFIPVEGGQFTDSGSGTCH